MNKLKFTVALSKRPVQHLDTIPGVSRQAAEVIIIEIGTDMSRFETADHLAAWAGVAPGNMKAPGNGTPAKRGKAINLWALS